MALPEPKQREIFSFVLEVTDSESRLCPHDTFYRCCVRFDLPIFEQVSMGVHLRFKELQPEVTQKYFGAIRMEEWAEVSQQLSDKYHVTGASEMDQNAFYYILRRLEK